MNTAHPQLRLRTRPNPNLRRLERIHPTLGNLQLVNLGGGPACWRTELEVRPGWRTVLDLTIGTNPSPKQWNEAAEFASWLAENENGIRERIATQLLAGDFVAAADYADCEQNLNAAEIQEGLRLCLVDFSPGWWKLSYDCLELPQGEFCGAQRLQLQTLDGVERLKLRKWYELADRIEQFFERPIPKDVDYARDTIAEQFMATRSRHQAIDLEDRKLALLLSQAIEHAQNESTEGSVAKQAYFREIAAILGAIRDGDIEYSSE